MTDQWKRHCEVCNAHGDTAWYVVFTPVFGQHRLRLTVRGTWSVDDMDIYWPTKGAAYHALETAPEPKTEASRVRELEEAVRVLAEMWQCETRVNLFAKLPDNDSRKEKAGSDFDAAYQRVLENPIAADAVKEAGR